MAAALAVGWTAGEYLARHSAAIPGATIAPARGVRAILWDVYEDFNRDRILLVAAGVTFFVLLAIFPAVTALVFLYGLFADISTISEHLTLLSDVVPSGGVTILSDQIARLTEQGPQALSLKLVVSVLVALWSANAGMKAMFDALNVAYRRHESRGFVMLNAQSLAFTLLALVAAAVMIAAVVAAPVALAFAGLTSFEDQAYAALRWPAVFFVVLVAHGLLYAFGPSRNGVKRRFFTVGGLVAAALWLAVSVLFSWYVSNFGNYDATYGTLGAVIGFMTWIWISTVITLVGAELNDAVARG